MAWREGRKCAVSLDHFFLWDFWEAHRRKYIYISICALPLVYSVCARLLLSCLFYRHSGSCFRQLLLPTSPPGQLVKKMENRLPVSRGSEERGTDALNRRFIIQNPPLVYCWHSTTDQTSCLLLISLDIPFSFSFANSGGEPLEEEKLDGNERETGRGCDGRQCFLEHFEKEDIALVPACFCFGMSLHADFGGAVYFLLYFLVLFQYPDSGASNTVSRWRLGQEQIPVVHAKLHSSRPAFLTGFSNLFVIVTQE